MIRMSIRPRRSVLYMPGSNPRAIEKARTLPADAVILDLEDSVAPDAKAAAREQIREAVVAGGFGAREVIVRINALEYGLVARGPRHGREGQARCGAGAQGFDPWPSGRRGRAACRHRRRSQDPRVGDDGDAARHAQCARDRGGGSRRREAACGLRDGHQRSRQGDAGKDHSRPFRHAAVADGLHRGGARLRPRYPRRRLQRSRRCARASRANAPRRGIWVSTARP